MIMKLSEFRTKLEEYEKIIKKKESLQIAYQFLEHFEVQNFSVQSHYNSIG